MLRKYSTIELCDETGIWSFEYQQGATGILLSIEIKNFIVHQYVILLNPLIQEFTDELHYYKTTLQINILHWNHLTFTIKHESDRRDNINVKITISSYKKYF